MLAKSLDAALQPELERRGISYTRYVDDMAFSGDDPMPFLTLSAKLLSKSGLTVHRTQSKAARGVSDGVTSPKKKPNKLRISVRSQAQQVTGLVVNEHDTVGLPREYRQKLRAAVHALSTEAGHSQNLASLASRIARVRKFHPGEGRRLQEYFEKLTA